MYFSGKNRRAGFTLLEVLVVVLILGILSSFALPRYRRSVERTRVAEAQTLLRAIYDSRERVAWERGYDSYAKSGGFGFNKLDITVKGTYNGKQLTTPNFIYDMSNGTSVTATARRGDYTGAKLTFNGQRFSCTGAASGEGAKACKVWGLASW